MAPTNVALAVDEGRVFVVGETDLAALAVADGRTLWRVPLPARVVRRPATRGGWVVVALETGALVALRAQDGKIVWTVTHAVPTTIDPIIEGDRVFAASGRGLVALDLMAGRRLWERPLDGRVTAAAYAQGMLYAGTASRWFYAIDEGSGGRVRWHWRIAGEPIGIVADGELAITLMLDHTMRAFKVGNGAQAWRETLLYRPFAGPVRAPGQLLIAGHGAMVRAYRESDGAGAGAYTMPAAGSADSPEQLDALGAVPYVRLGQTIVDDLLVLVTQRGTVHGARCQLMPALTPLTQLPGVPVSVPGRPPAAPGSSPP